MKIKGIVWLGTRTDRFDQMTEFCRDLLGMSQRSSEPGFTVFELPNGDLFEVFGPDSSFNEFMTHPIDLFHRASFDCRIIFTANLSQIAECFTC